MRKISILFLSLAMLLSALTGCGVNRDTAGDEAEKLQIVTTIFPVYDWVRAVLGQQAENADVTLLLDNGADLHSYQPTAGDMVRIAECDLFLYVGGESDEWVEDALKSHPNGERTVISLLDTLGDSVLAEEIVEGMEHDHDHDDAHHEEDHDHEEELDEHVWLSLRNAALFCRSIADALGAIDPDNREQYAANAEDYIARLTELDEQYAQAVEAAAVRTLLFGDRFPFRYLAEDYGLTYYAAFSGCSAETEASFETVVFLAHKVDELGLHAVLTIETGDGKLARTIVENTADKSAAVLTLDSMQSVTAQEIAAGAAYLTIMRQNLDVLRQALQ